MPHPLSTCTLSSSTSSRIHGKPSSFSRDSSPSSHQERAVKTHPGTVVTMALCTVALFASCTRGTGTLGRTIPLDTEYRPILPLLTVPAQHRPCSNASEALDPFQARCPQRSTPDLRGAESAAARLRARYGASKDPDALWALGLWRLHWLADRDDFDAAVRFLQQAAQLDPANAQLQSDLAAALYARGESYDSFDDVLAALASCERALELAPELVEANLNKALILARLGLHDQATQLLSEVSSGRADQRSHEFGALVTAMRGGAASQGRDAQDNSAQPSDSLYDRWEDSLRRMSRTRPKQGRRTHQAHLLGRRIAESLRDDLPSKITDAVIQHDARKSVLAFFEARDRYQARQVQEACESFHFARTGLAGQGNPLTHWVDYYLAVCSYWQGDYRDASRQLRELRRLATEHGFLRLGAYAEWMIGLIGAATGDLDGAFASYELGLSAFDTLGLDEEAAFLGVLTADLLGQLGERTEAGNRLLNALARSHAVKNPRRKHALFDEAAELARRMAQPLGATYLQREAVAHARATEDPVAVAEAMHRSATTLAAIGQVSAASEQLRAASRWTEQITDQHARGLVEAGVLLAESRVLEGPDPERVDRLDQAIDAFSSLSSRFLPELHLERGRLHAELGNPEAAEQDLLAAVRLYEVALSSVPLGRFVDPLARNLDIALHELAAFQLTELRDPVQALLTSERGAQVGRQGQEVSCGSDSWMSPKGTAIIRYSVIGDQVLALVVRGNSQKIVRLQATPQDISNLARELAPQAIASDSAREGALRRAWALMWQPLEAFLAPASTVLVSATPPIDSLPFPAFQDEQGRPLAHRYATAATPDIGSWLCGGTSLATSINADDGIVAVADPEIHKALSWLPRLPSSLLEVERLSELYPEIVALIGSEATPGRLQAELPGANILHLASHTALPSAVGGAFVLAPEEPGYPTGLLRAADLHPGRLSRLQLVVLAACNSGKRIDLEDYRAVPLATPFVRAAVPFVLVSIGSLQDAEAAEFMYQFYRELRSDVSPIEALRRVQLRAFTESPRPSNEWHLQLVVSPSKERSSM